MKKNRLRLLALVLAIVTMVTLIPAVSAENSVKNFTVNHYQQNIYDDNYTLVKTETKSGEVGTAVGDGHAKDYPGFFALPYLEESTIASDGSTVIDIYYDRHYYLMTFDLDVVMVLNRFMPVMAHRLRHPLTLKERDMCLPDGVLPFLRLCPMVI